MRWLAAFFALSLSSCATLWTTGSIYRGDCTHVGVRPEVSKNEEAMTLKVSTDWPVCTR